jgi:hypothetical protein
MGGDEIDARNRREGVEAIRTNRKQKMGTRYRNQVSFRKDNSKRRMKMRRNCACYEKESVE